MFFFFFFQAEDGIRDLTVTGVQTCALPLPALSRSVPTDPHRLDRGREAPAGCIRAAAPLLPQDDRAEQAVRDGAVGACASTTWSRPRAPWPRPAAGSRRSSSSPLS